MKHAATHYMLRAIQNMTSHIIIQYEINTWNTSTIRNPHYPQHIQNPGSYSRTGRSRTWAVRAVASWYSYGRWVAPSQKRNLLYHLTRLSCGVLWATRLLLCFSLHSLPSDSICAEEKLHTRTIPLHVLLSLRSKFRLVSTLISTFRTHDYQNVRSYTFRQGLKIHFILRTHWILALTHRCLTFLCLCIVYNL